MNIDEVLRFLEDSPIKTLTSMFTFGNLGNQAETDEQRVTLSLSVSRLAEVLEGGW